MSILIADLEMPTERESFNLTIKYNGTVLDTETGIQVAEAYELPAHGRLGDLDKLENGLRHMAKYQHGERQQGILGCCETIRLAPTVIPAE